MADKRLVFGRYTLRHTKDSDPGPTGWHVLDSSGEEIAWEEEYQDAADQAQRMDRSHVIDSLLLDISGCLDDLKGTDSVEVLVRLQAALAVLRS